MNGVIMCTLLPLECKERLKNVLGASQITSASHMRQTDWRLTTPVLKLEFRYFSYSQSKACVNQRERGFKLEQLNHTWTETVEDLLQNNSMEQTP